MILAKIMNKNLLAIVKDILIDAVDAFKLEPDEDHKNDHGICWYMHEHPRYRELRDMGFTEESDSIRFWFNNHYPELERYAFKFTDGYAQEDAWAKKFTGYDTARSDWCKEILEVHFDHVCTG